MSSTTSLVLLATPKLAIPHDDQRVSRLRHQEKHFTASREPAKRDSPMVSAHVIVSYRRGRIVPQAWHQNFEVWALVCGSHSTTRVRPQSRRLASTLKAGWRWPTGSMLTIHIVKHHKQVIYSCNQRTSDFTPNLQVALIAG